MGGGLGTALVGASRRPRGGHRAGIRRGAPRARTPDREVPAVPRRTAGRPRAGHHRRALVRVDRRVMSAFTDVLTRLSRKRDEEMESPWTWPGHTEAERLLIPTAHCRSLQPQ